MTTIPSERVRPSEIRHVPEQSLVRITWNDGHVGEYSYPYLRGWCPCAVCQGHGGQRNFLNFPRAQLVRLQGVGNYAVGLTWQDGHDTGIYSYRYLRELCPCPACQPAQGEA